MNTFLTGPSVFVDLRSFAFLQNASKYFKFTKNSSWRIFADFRHLFIIYLVQSVKINNCLNHDGPLFTAVYHGWPFLTTWETCLAFSKVIFVELKYLLTPGRFGRNTAGSNKNDSSHNLSVKSFHNIGWFSRSIYKTVTANQLLRHRLGSAREQCLPLKSE